MPGLSRRQSSRQEVVAIDLGTKVTKAVYVRRGRDGLELLNYVLTEAPPPEKAFSRGTWSEHLRKVIRLLGAPTRHVILALGPAQSVLTTAELPGAAVSDLRKMIKLSPKTFLQQDLNDHVFDCYLGGGAAEGEGTPRMRRKSRALVAGLRRPLLEDLVDGARDAGCTIEQITLAPVAMANAFRAGIRDAPLESVALLDIGFRTSTIGILHEGDLMLTRVVNAGAERLATVLEQATKGTIPEQDEEGSPLSDALQASLQKAISGLAREVDASIGFFLSQHDAPVSQVYVSGGSARSYFILQTLEAELGLPCHNWNPAGVLRLRLAEERSGEVEYEAPQLAVAVGAAASYLNPALIQINLLAERQEEVLWRRRDPVRRARWLAACGVAAVGLWGGWVAARIWQADQELERLAGQAQALRSKSEGGVRDWEYKNQMERQIAAMERHGIQRFLCADVLNALQFVTIKNIEFHRLLLERVVTRVEPPRVRPTRAAGRAEGRAPAKVEVKKPVVRERFVLRLQGKTYGDDPRDVNRLIDAIAGAPYFREHLRAENPVLLSEMNQPQVDPAQPERSFRMFTVECFFAERRFDDEKAD